MERTIEQIFEIEPKLKTLFGNIPAMMREAVDTQSPFFGRWSKIKSKFSELVGWHAIDPKPELTDADYDVVYRVFLTEAEKYDA